MTGAELRICKVEGCGKPIPPERGTARWTTCSRECDKARRAEESRKWRAHHNTPAPDIACKACNKTFTPPTRRYRYCEPCREKLNATAPISHAAKPAADEVMMALPAAPPVAPDFWPHGELLPIRFRAPVKVGRLAEGRRCRCGNPIFFEADVVCSTCQVDRYRAGVPVEAIKAEARRLM